MKSNLVVFIDSGHGGLDPGACYGKLREADLTLQTGLHLVALIRELHSEWQVITTRTTDVYVSPSKRRVLEVEANPDVFVSLHFNASDNKSATGIETVYRDEVDRPLASAMQKALVSELGLRDRGIKDDDDELGRSLAVLSSPNVPSVIVEPGFISNPIDLEVIKDTKRIASSILSGIVSWAEQKVQDSGMGARTEG